MRSDRPGSAELTVILVVEDNPKNLDLMLRILDVNGFKTLSATDGEEGIKVATEALPALILMDIQMPRVDGYAALATIRSQAATEAIPVIAVTGNATDHDRARAREAGFQSFVAKPYKIDHLLEEIDLALRNAPGTG